MAACCDTAAAGDETMFRFSEDKLLAEVLFKAGKMAAALPASMEDKFVTRALEAPVLGIKRVKTLQKEESTLSEAGTTGSTITNSSQSEMVENSQASLVSTSTAATSVADEGSDTVNGIEVESAMQACEEIVKLQRLRIAFNFICSSYLPPAMTTVLKKMLAEGKGAAAAVDFKPLDEYVAQLARLRQEATLSRSASDYSRKRSMDQDNEEKREKRRKKEEEEKRKKAGESRGVRELKKVNTAGMKKLSAFFKPKGS